MGQELTSGIVGIMVAAHPLDNSYGSNWIFCDKSVFLQKVEYSAMEGCSYRRLQYKVWHVFCPHDADIILGIHLPATPSPDRIIWFPDKGFVCERLEHYFNYKVIGINVRG